MSDIRRSVFTLVGAAMEANRAQAGLLLVLAPALGAAGVLPALAIRQATDAALSHDSAAAGLAVVLLIAALLISNQIGAMASNIRIRLQEGVGLVIDQRMMALSAGAPTLAHHERPDFQDQMELLRVNRAQMGGGFGALVECLRAFALFATTVALLVTVRPALLFLPLFAVPAIVLVNKGGRLTMAADKATAEAERLRQNLLDVACTSASAAEIRIYGVTGELEKRHDELMAAVNRRRGRASIRADLLTACGWVVFGLGYLGAIYLALTAAARGDGDAGSVILTVTLGGQLLGNVSGLVGLGRWFQQALQATGYLLWLTDHIDHPRASYPEQVPGHGAHELVIDHVSFTYPGTRTPILEDISLRIPAGCTVAVVGDNGAGKTTLAKLICRMYEPTTGTISYGGVDLADIDPAQWRSVLSAAFQDFCRFEFTVGESVGVGDVVRSGDTGRILDALDRAGARDLVDRLSAGLDTQLGAGFPGGVDLSTGQWQKVAMARALMRAAPRVIVLDEPTASLDAATEQDLFAALSRTGHDAITVLVSHRFATVRSADLIAVLDRGRVEEVGTHAQLLAREGRYAEMYELHARGYSTTAVRDV